jgi:hypothetical protein
MGEARTSPTYGQYIRGCRIGFRYAPSLRCMMRIEAHEPLFRVELCHPTAMPSGPDKTPYVCWWEDKKDPEALVRMSPALAELAVSGRVVNSETWWLDEQGNRVMRGPR